MTELFALIKHYRNGLSATLALIVALVLMLSSVRSHEQGQQDFLSEVVLDVVGPVQQMLLSPLVAYRRVQTRIAELKQLDLDNRRMAVELERLRPLGSRLEELRQENLRLQKLLAMPVQPVARRIAARVVGDTSSAFARSLIIQAGRLEGVDLNAIVVVPEGLLGRVVRVGSHTSLVLTLLDLNSRVPVVVQRSRSRGIAAGFNGRALNLEYVDKEGDVQVGDRILTSGTGGGYPKGLVVGVVETLAAKGSGLFRQVTVAPMVDFDRVEEVTLLIPSLREEDPAWDADSVLTP